MAPTETPSHDEERGKAGSPEEPGTSEGASAQDADRSEIQRLGERILEEAPRLGLNDEFQFRCHPGVSCFGECCRDINIALTPYDVLRLRARLGMKSSEFIAEHTIVPFTKEQRLPVPLIKMRDDEHKTCPFNEEGKCTVYEDRPWACRMYPLGFAAPREDVAAEPFYFLLEEEGCGGFGEDATQTVREWIRDQGIAKYDEMGSLFQPLSFDARLADGRELSPKQMEMYWMSTYDLDTFRRFVFESSFLDRFDLSDDEVEKIREDDEELMRFAFRWLSFALSGQRTLKVKENADPEQSGD